MSIFSIISVTARYPSGLIDGHWVQDHIGTLATAAAVANRHTELNPGSEFEVTEQISSTTPALSHWTGLKKPSHEETK